MTTIKRASRQFCEGTFTKTFEMKFFLATMTLLNSAVASPAEDFAAPAKPLVEKYCAGCHSGDDASGSVDFDVILTQDLAASAEVWEKAVEHVQHQTMPPADEDQPTAQERTAFSKWFRSTMDNVKAKPGVFRPRRLAVNEYRNSLASVFGFDLEVAIIEAEQTIAEKSMVVKLLPIDPPGESGFKNDTHRNPISTIAWDQYAYLADAAIEKLFSNEGAAYLAPLSGPENSPDAAQKLTYQQAATLLKTVLERSRRRVVSDVVINNVLSRINGKQGDVLTEAVKFELKTMLMSPSFLYRGLLLTRSKGSRQLVDEFELAERLSYFLWADSPDSELIKLAAHGNLRDGDILIQQIGRMLQSPKARSLTDDFATQWLTLQEIEHVSDNVPKMIALKSQPEDFMNYLFTEDRPLLELIDSDVAFINPHTSKMYGKDAKQMTRYRKQKGIEVEVVANQKIQLNTTAERGGILTMPGVLAMNRGPIIRGTWILERILGDELPEPPANVGQVQPNTGGRKLSFRERFEMHRAQPACAVCHDKIDPLGFALQTFDNGGKFVGAAKAAGIDTRGQLPSGESFDNMQGLKDILMTTQRRATVRNIVERTMSYALCRKLVIYDRPTIESITETMIKTNGTWSELFVAIAHSIPFQETILAAHAEDTNQEGE